MVVRNEGIEEWEAEMGPRPVFPMYALLLPLSGGSGDGFSLEEGGVCKSRGHVTHFPVTWKKSVAKPRVFNSVAQANLFFPLK